MKTWMFMLATTIVLVSSSRFSGAGEKLKIGLALPTQQEERWIRDLRAIQDEAKKLGIDLHTAIARNNQSQQNTQIEQLLSQGIKVLILAPHDSEEAAGAVDKAHAAGVKVISYDRLILGTNLDVYISFDNVRVGELMGNWITNRVPRGDYIIMSGAPTDNNAKLFKQGHMMAIQPLIDKGDIKVIVDQPVINWQPANAQRIVENALAQVKNRVDAILAPNDGTASGAIAALEAYGLAGKVPVTGMDAELSAAQRVVRGTQAITVFKDTRKLGEAAIRVAVKMAEGEDISPDIKNQFVNNGKMDVPSILLDAEVVDKDNIDQVLIDSGYLSRAQVYAK